MSKKVVDYIKMQIKIIKDMYKYDNNKIKDIFDSKVNAYAWGYDEVNHFYKIYSYGYFAIPKEFLYINLDKLKQEYKGQNIGSYEKGKDAAKVGSVLYDIKRDSKRTYRVIKFEDENGEKQKIYINIKLLENSGINPDLIHYRCTGTKSPVYLYNSDFYIGLILPVNYKENEDV